MSRRPAEGVLPLWCAQEYKEEMVMRDQTQKPFWSSLCTRASSFDLLVQEHHLSLHALGKYRSGPLRDDTHHETVSCIGEHLRQRPQMPPYDFLTGHVRHSWSCFHFIFPWILIEREFYKFYDLLPTQKLSIISKLIRV